MPTVKLVVVGDEEANKTHLLLSFTCESSLGEYVPVVFENHVIMMMIRGEPVEVLLHDTTGQEEYPVIRPISYSETDVFLVCFSVVSPSSYENVREKWVPEITRHRPNTLFLLVGTRTDLRDDRRDLEKLAKCKQRPLRPEDGEELARQLRAVKYMECSAQTKEGVDEVFEEAVLAVLEKKRRMSASWNRLAGCFMCTKPQISEQYDDYA